MAAGGSNERSNLEGLYKIVYPEGIQNPFPDQTPLKETLKFREDKRLGKEYQQPVILSLPGGVTYGGSAGLVYTLDGEVSGDVQFAKIKGSEFTIQETLSYGAAKAARGGAESFRDALGHIFEGMGMTGTRRCEASILHGRSTTGLGEVESVASLTVTFKEASWAPGLFLGCKNHRVTFWAPGFSTKRVDTTITSVNIEDRTLTVAAVTGVVAGDLVLFTGMRKGDGSAWNDGVGITTALNTTSGTVFEIDVAANEIWKASRKDAGGVDASFDKLSTLLSDMYVKGASGEQLGVCSTDTWTNLISPEVAVRRHDASFKPEKVTVGHDAIEFRHMTGRLKILAHPMCKSSEMIIISPREWRRIGSTDLTFEQDVGSNIKRIFLHLAGKNGVELRAYLDNAPFTKRLGVAGYLFNIVNS